MKKYLLLLIIPAIAIVFSGIQGKQTPEHLKLKAPKEDVIKSKEKDGVVKYLYKSTVEVPKAKHKGKDEDMFKRTKNAQFFPDGNKTISRFYTGTPFYKDIDDKWYQTETATTTVEIFNEQINILLGASGDPIYSGAGDGYIWRVNEATWAGAHDTLDGAGVNYVNDIIVGSNDDFDIRRASLSFNTASLPDDASISDATLNVYVYNKYNLDNDGNDFIVVVESTVASDVELATGDYDEIGDSLTDPTEGSGRIDVGVIVDDQYNIWTLDNDGKGWISLIGYTKLGMREGHDVVNNAPDLDNGIQFRASETADTTSDPYLVVTYTVGSAASDPMIGIKGGTLNLKGGTLQIK